MKQFLTLPATVVAVSKFRTQAEVNVLKQAGFTLFAENRVQELKKKAIENPEVTWHLIGHLQTNKVKDAVRYASMIQSVDSLHLLEEINHQAAKINKVMPVLIQLNIAQEPQKFGLDPQELFPFITQASSMENILIQGIMAMAPDTEDTQVIHDVFAQGKQYFDQLKTISQANLDVQFLSMGMSHDYEIAIEEGANMVRIGSKLFASIPADLLDAQSNS